MSMGEQIKRYEIYMHSDDVQFLRECEDGDYVRLTDHDAALAAEQAKLGAEIDQRDARIGELDAQLAAAKELVVDVHNSREVIRAERDTAREMLRDARKLEAQAWWDAINAHIKTGQLPFKWMDDTRNGMVLATNLVMQRITEHSKE
jgi:chromosome segregation ATPase